MSTLVSPGVDVQIIDESFYTGAAQGTVPLIVIATAANKANPSGTGVAAFTTSAMSGKLLLATSQRELVQSYGNPKFYSFQGTPIHGHELNEYGLHAAYSFLGIQNRCYVLRADIDLAQLEASVEPPRGQPISGTYWLDLHTTQWGVFQSNGQQNPGSAWVSQPVKVAMLADIDTDYVPLDSFGTDGDFAVVPMTASNFIYEKISGRWYRIGSAEWLAKRPTTIRGAVNPPSLTDGDIIVINGVPVTFNAGTLENVVATINGAGIPNVIAEIGNDALVIKEVTGHDLTIANGNGEPLKTLGLNVSGGVVRGNRVFRTSDAQYPSGSVQGDVWVKGTPANKGANWAVRYWDGSRWISLTAPFFPFNSLLDDGASGKDEAALHGLGVPATGTVYVGYDADTGVQELRRFNGSHWELLTYEAEMLAPTTDPAEGTLWYNADFRADIMVSDGKNWIAYRRAYPMTDVNGPQIAASAPTTQSDGKALVDDDLWIDSSDMENYPAIYRFDAAARRWRRVDNTDQTTPFGIVFADARQDSGVPFEGQPNPGEYTYNSTAGADMALSDFVDPDAPDARMYPAGMLLFNTRYSTQNVKEWRPHYFEHGGFDPETDFTLEGYTVGDPGYQFPPLAAADGSPRGGRWVTASGNKADGSPYMGRKAQRAMVVRSMAAALSSNEDIRSELVHFNLIAAPGYPELIDEMVTLNTDQKEVSFVIGDTPIRLKPNATDIQNWAKNAKMAASNGEDGLTSSNVYTGIYYPWGLGTNVDGSEIMVPPSTIALRTMAYNDSVSYPWFAPAGFQRGLVTNVTSVGYLTDEGEFQPVILNQGQRDTLYENKINPIAYIPGKGLVVYGQKTLAPLDSALDRINVARLANYVKYNLDIAVKPFLFEPNDQQTRKTAQNTVERFFNTLVGLRALSDYAVLCDETNNTPDRIDRNELWIDVLIKPLKAVEFIYIPVRIMNTSAPLLTQEG